jgi:hypothetical protein
MTSLFELVREEVVLIAQEQDWDVDIARATRASSIVSLAPSSGVFSDARNSVGEIEPSGELCAIRSTVDGL